MYILSIPESWIKIDTKESNKAKETTSSRYRGTFEGEIFIEHAGSRNC